MGSFPPNDHRVRVATCGRKSTGTTPSSPSTNRPRNFPKRRWETRFCRIALPGLLQGNSPREASAPAQCTITRRLNKAALVGPLQGKSHPLRTDVQELCFTETDDCMVVLGSGDEMDCPDSTRPRSPSPPGWKRDFLIYQRRLDKTATGTPSTAPTPTRCRTTPCELSYPPEKPFPQDKKHDEYAAKWQTREQSFKNSGRWNSRYLVPALPSAITPVSIR